jgi:hypothetical protein
VARSISSFIALISSSYASRSDPEIGIYSRERNSGSLCPFRSKREREREREKEEAKQGEVAMLKMTLM